jgi:hypothetical protein
MNRRSPSSRSPLTVTSRRCPIDRRVFLALGSACCFALLAPAGTAALAVDRRLSSAASTLVVADRRYGDSVRFAEALARRGATVLPLDADMATFWFDEVVPCLAKGASRLAGLTLEADRFVIERLAEVSPSCTSYVGRHDWRTLPGSSHTLAGAISLAGVTEALETGQELWAASLGTALASVEGPCSRFEERQLALDLAPAADSPRFFTSWLMNLAS